MGQVAYGQQPQLVVGQVADDSPATIDTYTNELLAQVTSADYAGVTDDAGDYSLRIEGPDGEVVEVTHTSPGSETSAQIATAIVALLEAELDFANMATVADGGSGDLTLTFLHAGRVYDVSGEVVAGTLTIDNDTDAGGSNIGLGLGVEYGSEDTLATVVDGSTTDINVAGVTVRSVDALVNELEGPTVEGAENTYQPGKTMSVMRGGVCAVRVEDAVTKGAQAFMRIANGTALNPAGGWRSDADGGDAISITGATFGSSTTGAGIALLRLNRP